MSILKFFQKKEKQITLEYVSTEEATHLTCWVADVNYAIMLDGIKIGECDLRLGMNEELYYAGQVGYRIYYPFRGNGYAYNACKLLFEIAKKQYGMHELLITCSPDNIPSDQTLRKLQGKYIKTVEVPRNHYLYARGELIKKIYIFTLD